MHIPEKIEKANTTANISMARHLRDEGDPTDQADDHAQLVRKLFLRTKPSKIGRLIADRW